MGWGRCRKIISAMVTAKKHPPGCQNRDFGCIVRGTLPMPAPLCAENWSEMMSVFHPQPVVIACGADDQYVQPLAVMLQSVFTNLSSNRSVVLYIIDGGIDPAHKWSLVQSWDRHSVSVHWLSPRESSF